MKVFLLPDFNHADQGDGGIRRIVEAQRKHLPRLGFDMVDTVEEADLVATHAGINLRVPISKPWVVHTHGLYWAEYQWPNWCHKLNREVIDAMRKADFVTAPSEWVAQTLRRGMWLRPEVLYHGIDADEFVPGANGEYILWNKTRVDPVCDPKPVNELAAVMKNRQFVTTFGEATANVQLTGKMPHDSAKEYLRNAGVYLCTTRETFGIGTLEAMACGVPVVGWNWGGQREIIKQHETGLLVRPGDFAALAEAIEWALASRDEVGAAAMADVRERFSWETRIREYARIYETAVEKKSAYAMNRLSRTAAQNRQTEAIPDVSVIMPCYKLSRYLRQALLSLKAQTLGSWECLVVDDCNEPEEAAAITDIVASMDDERITILRNDRNLYLAGALNRGIAKSEGRYVLPLDADNMISPETMRVLADHLDANREVAIAYGAVKFVLDDGITEDLNVGPDGVSGWPESFSFKGQITHRNQIPSTSMYRREVWERSGGYRERCKTAEDADFWTRVTSIGFIPKKVTHGTTLIYRQRADSMSRVEANWDWPSWFPWSRDPMLCLFGTPEKVPERLNNGLSWHVPSYEPPQVSIVIPVGVGHEKMLIDALDSVQAQSFQNWECIVVNDTGAPLNVPHSWAKVLDTGGVKGPAAARNMGIRASIGKVFIPLDADDMLQPDFITMMLPIQEQFGGVAYSAWWDDFGSEMRMYDPPEYEAQLLISRGAIHAVTAMYPKEAWEKVGGFDETLSHWEDWDFQIALASVGTCATRVPFPLWTYRKHTGKRREEHLAAFEKGKAAILRKWGTFFEGKETLMACRSCPGGGGGAYPVPPPIDQQQAAGGELVILEYQSVNMGDRTYTGKETQTSYRFGESGGNRRRYVYRKDAVHLLNVMEGGKRLFVEVAPMASETGAPVELAPRLETARLPTPETGPLPEAQVQPEVSAGPGAPLQPAPAPSAPMEAKAEEDEDAQPVAVGGRASAVPAKSLRELRATVKDMSTLDLTKLLAAERQGANRDKALDIFVKEIERRKDIAASARTKGLGR